MNYDYSKIKGKIRELDMTQKEFADFLNISEQTLNKRFHNERPFKQEEIIKTMKLFNEPLEKIHLYFFTEKVQKNRTN